MAIERGEDWGALGAAPEGLPWFDSDRSASRFLESSPSSPVGLSGGDLARTLGAGTGDSHAKFEVDLMRIRWRGAGGSGEALALAHAIASRRRGWRGPIVVVMNSQYCGEWDVAPRGHPNDTRAEVLAVDQAMSVRQRWNAWRRLPLGTHLPHPSIGASSRGAGEWSLDRPSNLRIDGEHVARVEWFSFEVVPDGAVVWVRI